MPSLRKDITVFILTIALIFGSLSLVLWTTLPYGCSWQECYFTYLNQKRFDFLLLLGFTISIVVAPTVILFGRNYRVQNGPFSSLGKAALIWQVVSCISMFIHFVLGTILAPIGLGIAVVAVIVSVIRRITQWDAKFHWGDLSTFALNMAWVFVSYFYLVRFWELFGD
jgi:hypothetical protein